WRYGGIRRACHPRERPGRRRCRSRALYIPLQPMDQRMSHEQPGARRVGQVKEVTSLSNPIIKDIKALSNKKERDETKSFMAEGLKLVIDALELGFEIKTLVYAKNVKDKPQVEQVAKKTFVRGGL